MKGNKLEFWELWGAPDLPSTGERSLAASPLVVALRMFIALTLLTGLLYPLLVTLLSTTIFPYQARGSIATSGGRAIGSELLAQSFTNAAYFWPRPSAADFGTVPSGASNKGPTAQELCDAVTKRIEAYRKENGLKETDAVPTDAVTASGSGLDPHITRRNAELQLSRVARARNIDPERVRSLIRANTDSPDLGLFGEARVNVVKLNLALDSL